MGRRACRRHGRRTPGAKSIADSPNAISVILGEALGMRAACCRFGAAACCGRKESKEIWKEPCWHGVRPAPVSRLVDESGSRARAVQRAPVARPRRGRRTMRGESSAVGETERLLQRLSFHCPWSALSARALHLKRSTCAFFLTRPTRRSLPDRNASPTPCESPPASAH